MRYLLTLYVLVCVTVLVAWDIAQFGPTAGQLTCASMDGDVPVFGGQVDNSYGIYLQEGGNWEFHPIWMTAFPIRAVCPQSANIIMGAYGFGSYSDGIYNYDVTTGAWTLNDWFFWPNFIIWHPAGQKYYAGERDGLYKSISGNDWSRVTTLPMGQCDSFAAWGDYAVTDIGNSVYYSGDAGQTWHLSSMVMLDGFRYASDGTLFAKMDAGSDSDGLWSSEDHGSSWSVVFYSTGISSIGPLFDSSLPLGWRIPNEDGYYAGMYDLQTGLEHLDYVQLDSPVLDIEVFPLINTPSAYYLNSSGCYYITGFTVADDDPAQTPAVPDNTLRISPNPTSNRFLAVASKPLREPRATLYDLRGRKIASLESMTWDGSELRCSLPDLKPGVYMLRVEDGNTIYHSRLCVIK
jgi:hypothetical protein